MKNKIICLVLSLVLLGSLVGANGAYAWFVSSSGGASGSAGAEHLFTTGNIGYTLFGDLYDSDDTNKIIPEQELLVALSDGDKLSDENCRMYLKSTSSVDSQLRIRILYDYGADSDKVYGGEQESPLTVEFCDASGWVYNNGYFYYGSYDANSDSSTVIPAYDATEEGATPAVIALFDSIRYSGENTESDEISGKTLNVKIIFEARQSEYVNWTDVGTIYTSSETE